MLWRERPGERGVVHGRFSQQGSAVVEAEDFVADQGRGEGARDRRGGVIGHGGNPGQIALDLANIIHDVRDHGSGGRRHRVELEGSGGGGGAKVARCIDYLGPEDVRGSGGAGKGCWCERPGLIGVVHSCGA